MSIPPEIITKAAGTLISQLGAKGVDNVGGSKWWQWRRNDSELRAEWIEMRGNFNERKRRRQTGRRVMLYVHGGAYFFGSVDEHRYQMQRHARKLRARVFAPRYRLAPQFPFPCGLHDCLAAYLYLLTVQEPEEIILAGDSAGGGMAVSMLVTLRDQGLPLPAGAVLISPWVDLTHSFPSVAGDSQLDYIPAHGFMQRPSPSWPPPNDDETAQIATGQSAADGSSRKSADKERGNPDAEAVHGLAVQNPAEEEAMTRKQLAPIANGDVQYGNNVPGAGHNLSIEIDGKLIVLEDQIQLYATNQLISHPLVSPVLQPSLGGLSPLLVLTGGGEILRDEQIYLAHKAANPGKYPLGDIYQAEFDTDNEILKKYEPTDVQLQVWDDLCHVGPTLSFTRPAKFMYRSIAQFGAWALARAQRRSIEITDDDDLSVISSGSDTDSHSSTDLERPRPQNLAVGVHHVGKAGDPLPAFKNHMIRQRVDRHGVIYPMAPESDIPALQMPASDVGVIKPGPVRKWLAAKKEWDTRYASAKRKVLKIRIKEMMEGGFESFGERPPPSALAGRRRKGRVDDGVEKRKKKSWGLMLWSLWGSKHDESTIRREEEMMQDEAAEEEQKTNIESADDTLANGAVDLKDSRPKSPRSRATSTGSRPRTRRKFTMRSASSSTKLDLSRTRSRRRTVTIADQGQTGATLVGTMRDSQNTKAIMDQDRQLEGVTTTTIPISSNEPFLSPTYIPKQTIQPIDPLSRPRNLYTTTDASGTSPTTTAGLRFGSDHESQSPRNASAIAVLEAPGVIETQPSEATPPPLSSSFPLSSSKSNNNHNSNGAQRSTTPFSTASRERLTPHQLENENQNQNQNKSEGRDLEGKKKSPAAEMAAAAEISSRERPAMYDRADTEFLTAKQESR